jgi:hypothetical protein
MFPCEMARCIAGFRGEARKYGLIYDLKRPKYGPAGWNPTDPAFSILERLEGTSWPQPEARLDVAGALPNVAVVAAPGAQSQERGVVVAAEARASPPPAPDVAARTAGFAAVALTPPAQAPASPRRPQASR